MQLKVVHTVQKNKSGNKFGIVNASTRFYLGVFYLTNQFKETFHLNWNSILTSESIKHFTREIYNNKANCHFYYYDIRQR